MAGQTYLTPDRFILIELLERHKNLTSKELQQHMNKTHNSVNRLLLKLSEIMIVKVERNKGTGNNQNNHRLTEDYKHLMQVHTRKLNYIDKKPEHARSRIYWNHREILMKHAEKGEWERFEQFIGIMPITGEPVYSNLTIY